MPLHVSIRTQESVSPYAWLGECRGVKLAGYFLAWHSKASRACHAAGAGGVSAELTTRQRMRRDRGMHELGLAGIEALPHDVLVDTLQQLCLAAGTADATALPGCLATHMRASAALPELERFVDTVCEVGAASTSFDTALQCMH